MQSVRDFLDCVKRDLKIALVKQNIYKDLYLYKGEGKNKKDLAYSSNQRTGPLGLISAFDVEMIIVDVEEDPECNIWKEKYIYCKHWTEEQLRGYADHKFEKQDGSLITQREVSVPASSVDWNQYDVVIAYDCAIPSRIVKKFPNVIWCLCVTEGCMPSFAKALTSLPDGYNFNLNHHFRPDKSLDQQLHGMTSSAFSIDCPYFLQYYGCIHEILGVDIDGSRHGVVIDPACRDAFSPEQLEQLNAFGSIRFIRGGVWEVIDALIESKYYLRVGKKYVLGNSSIEAVSSGCAFLSSPIGIKNRTLQTKEMTLSGADFDEKQFAEIIKKLKEFECDSDLLNRSLTEQRDILDYHCFVRPLSTILNKYM